MIQHERAVKFDFHTVADAAVRRQGGAFLLGVLLVGVRVRVRVRVRAAVARGVARVLVAVADGRAQREVAREVARLALLVVVELAVGAVPDVAARRRRVVARRRVAASVIVAAVASVAARVDVALARGVLRADVAWVVARLAFLLDIAELAAAALVVLPAFGRGASREGEVEQLHDCSVARPRAALGALAARLPLCSRWRPLAALICAKRASCDPVLLRA